MSSGNEFNGRSVDEATANGLKTLGLRSNQVRVEVVNKGSRGLFGIGSEPAVVRLIRIEETSPVVASVIPIPTQSIPTDVVQTVNLAIDSEIVSNEVIADDGIDEFIDTKSELTQAVVAENRLSTIAERVDAKDNDAEVEVDVAAEEAETEATSVEFLGRLVSLMGFQTTIDATWKDEDDEHDDRVLWLNMRGSNLLALIGRRGETLDSIQYLLRMMVNQRLHRWNDIVVDVDQYRARRSEQLTQMAHRMADQVVSSGRAMSLEPMPPNERRIIHMALRDHAQVYTQSSGEGERRKIFIVLKS